MCRTWTQAQIAQVPLADVRQEVCRSLELDLRGQTSASYNMRLNYEKSLLDFEHYLSSGAYADDVAAGVQSF